MGLDFSVRGITPGVHSLDFLNKEKGGKKKEETYQNGKTIDDHQRVYKCHIQRLGPDGISQIFSHKGPRLQQQSTTLLHCTQPLLQSSFFAASRLSATVLIFSAITRRFQLSQGGACEPLPIDVVLLSSSSLLLVLCFQYSSTSPSQLHSSNFLSATE